MISFILGLHFGQRIKDSKPIVVNPVKAVKESRIIKKQKEETEREKLVEEINLANIENYNGTSIGQQDFPE